MFPNSHSRMTSDSELVALDIEELDEYEKINKTSIETLQMEIALLKAQIKQFGPDALPSVGCQVFQRYHDVLSNDSLNCY